MLMLFKKFFEALSVLKIWGTAITIRFLHELEDVFAPAPNDGDVLTYEASSSLWKNKASSSTDEKVAVDSAAAAGYLGSTSVSGVLRTTSPLTYADGGDFITLGVNQAAIDHGSLGGLADDDHTQYRAFNTITGDTGSATADANPDTLTIAGGTGISTSVSGDTLTITNTSPNADQNLFETIACPAGTNPIADSTTDTLTLTSGHVALTITGNATTDTVAFNIVEANLSHNNLGGLQGGQANEYYHLTSAEYSDLIGGSGSAGQVAYWSDSDTLTGESGFFWSTIGDYLQIGGAPTIISSGTKLILKNDTNTSDHVVLHLQAGTIGSATIQMGDDDNPTEASISYNNSTQDLTITAEDKLLLKASDEEIILETLAADKTTEVLSNTTSTAGKLAALKLHRKTSGNMTAGFGTSIKFLLSDSGVSNSVVGSVGVQRENADNTGAVRIVPYASGSPKVGLVVSGQYDGVGIGLFSPLEKLHVSDKIRADTCFNVNGTDGISQMIQILDGNGVNRHLLTFTGGILTGYAYV